jgi:hypothetical protein
VKSPGAEGEKGVDVEERHGHQVVAVGRVMRYLLTSEVVVRSHLSMREGYRGGDCERRGRRRGQFASLALLRDP